MFLGVWVGGRLLSIVGRARYVVFVVAAFVNLQGDAKRNCDGRTVLDVATDMMEAAREMKHIFEATVKAQKKMPQLIATVAECSLWLQQATVVQYTPKHDVEVHTPASEDDERDDDRDDDDDREGDTVRGGGREDRGERHRRSDRVHLRRDPDEGRRSHCDYRKRKADESDEDRRRQNRRRKR